MCDHLRLTLESRAATGHLLPPRPQLLYFQTDFFFKQRENVFSSLVLDRPAHQPGVSTSPDPSGAEGALRRRGRRIPLPPHGSNRADDLRGPARQVPHNRCAVVKRHTVWFSCFI